MLEKRGKYERLVSRLSSPKALEAWEKRSKELLFRRKKELARAKEIQKELGKLYPPTDRRYVVSLREVRKASKRLESARRAAKMEVSRHSIIFTGMHIHPRDIVRAGGILAGVAFAISALSGIVLALLLGLGPTEVGLYLVLPAAAAPLAVLLAVTSYPDIRASRLRVQSLGRTPEAVNYLLMSMRLTPSLERAVKFASENSEEPLASAFKRVLWSVTMRTHSSLEDALTAFAMEWGRWNESFKRAMYLVRSAALERTTEGLNATLDKASEVIVTGTRRRIESFTASLSGPTMVLFALGVLLPMVVGAMLPMMALGGLSADFSGNADVAGAGSSMVAGVGAEAEQADDAALAGNALGIFMLMDVTFPLVALVYSYSILGKRPGTSSPPHIPPMISPGKRRGALAAAVLLAVTVSLPALPIFRDRLGVLGKALGWFPVILGAGLAIGLYASVTVKDRKREKDRIARLECEFPDALFQLGSRIAEGDPLESALQKTIESMEGSEVGELFKGIIYSLQVTRSTLRGVLFGNEGLMRKHPSRTVAVSLKMVVEAMEKDARTAGKTIIGIASYLRGQKDLDNEVKKQLGLVVDMMKTTATLFSPMVLGITAGIYVVLSSAFSKISDAGMVSREFFGLVLGIYLLLSVLIIMYFSSGIQHGPDPVERRALIARSVPLATVVFVVTGVLGQMFLGS